MASLRKRGAFYYARFRTVDGKQTEVKLSRDKQSANAMLRELEDRQHRIKHGLLSPRELAAAQARRIPLSQHVADYVADLEARGCVPEHVACVQRRLTWFLETTKVANLHQLRPSIVQSAVKELRLAGKADRTIAHFVSTLKSFAAWLKKDQRTVENLLQDLERPKVVNEHKRTALEPAQLARLIAVTRAGKSRCGMSGVDRAWLYTLAALTGYRRSELQSLRPESFQLDGAPPVVRVEAERAKNRQEAIQPLPDHTVARLRAWLAGKPPGVPLFPSDRNSSLMIKADLKAAGVPSDPFDFHCLRHTFTTYVDSTGASHKETMTLARHSNANLTFGRYAHARLQDLARVVNNLPDLTGECGQENAYAFSSHTLPTFGVSDGSSGSLAFPVKQRLEETGEDQKRLIFESG